MGSSEWREPNPTVPQLAAAAWRRATSPGRQEAVKALAVATMIADHLGKTVLIDHEPALSAVGRFAWPAFTWLLCLHLAERPDRHRRYLPWLVGFALLASPPWRVIAGAPGLCVLGAFGLGVLADGAVTARRWGLAALLLLASPAYGPWIEFGPAAVWVIPACAGLLRAGRPGLAQLALAAAVATQPAPHAVIAALFAVALPAVAAALPAAPRAPRWLWYAVYAGHLWALWLFVVVGLGYPAHWVWEVWRTPP